MKCMILIIIAFLNRVQCSRILMVFPFPSPSHYILGNALARGLVEAGHNVTMVSPYEEKNPPKNGTFTAIVLSGIVEEQKRAPAIDFFSLEKASPFVSNINMVFVFEEVTRRTLEHPNFQKLIHSNEHFDVVIVEIFNNDALNGLAHHFNAPLILFSSLGPNEWINPLVGNPSPPSYIPDRAMKFTSNMTFLERLINWVFSVQATLVRNLLYFPVQNTLMKKHFTNVPDLNIVNYNASIVLMNSHESTNQAVPNVPCMIDIGGFHVNPPKVLPKDIQDFMDSAKEGVVYFSMGSNIKPSDMPEQKRQAILKALGKIKQKVLWKWDEDSLPGKPENVLLSKWFPQQDILAHPNVRLFITHGGLLSTTETIYHGVPILVFPVFGDQKMNGARAEMNGFGLSLPFSELTEEKLTDALDKLLNDPIYRDNAKWRSKLLHDRPMRPMDLAVYWVEYVIRHQGAPHLRVAGLDLPWYKYLLLDILAFVILVSIIIATVLFVIIKNLCKKKVSYSKVKDN